MKIEKLMEMLEKGELVRGSYQRTPSHDLKKSREIVGDILKNKFAGALTFSKNPEGEIVEIIDGSSRLADIENFTNGKFGIITQYLDENSKLCKKEIFFQELEEEEKISFLNYEFPILDVEWSSRLEMFVKLNSATTLSVVQKNKGNLNSCFAQCLEEFKKSHVCSVCLTDRQLQKDEDVSIIAQIIANVNVCYSSSNSKLMENIRDKSIDVDTFKSILRKMEGLEDISKYHLISVVSALMTPDGKGRKVDISAIDEIDSRYLNFKIDTAGANSAEKNTERIKKARSVINKLLPTVGSIDNDLQDELEELAK